jgi:hypothetical protein
MTSAIRDRIAMAAIDQGTRFAFGVAETAGVSPSDRPHL